jgi:arylsulfatase A-like enzyme
MKIRRRRRDGLAAVLVPGLLSLLSQHDAAGAPAPTLAGPAPPNVVVIVADDLGYGDVCAYGCEAGRTPHLDALAASGVRFDRAYVTSPVCVPSRAGLLSGRYQQRFGQEFLARERGDDDGSFLGETLLPKLLRDRGYATGMVGKWHLGADDDHHPLARGFDEFFGFLGGASLYIEPLEGPGIHFVDADVAASRRTRDSPILRGREPVPEAAYLTEAFTREAVDFIGRHRARPFFLYVAYNAPHTPLQVTDRYYDRFPEIADEPTRIFAAMVSALDDGVGELVEALRESGIERRTLVLFLSDNGCAAITGACSNGPLLGAKLTHFEGGVRVPFIASWTGTMPAGRVINEPVSALDIAPTALAIAGGAPAAGGTPPTDSGLDGVDLLPLLRGDVPRLDDRDLFWRNGKQWAVLHDRRFKLVHVSDRLRFLFDVAADGGETRDLAASRPELVATLESIYAGWSRRMAPPRWDVARSVYLSLDDLMARRRRIDFGFEPVPGAVELTP